MMTKTPIPIPTNVRDYDSLVVTYSGGKDSTAMLLWALNHLPHDRLRIVYCATNAEWPEVYDYMTYVQQALNVRIETVQAGDVPLPPGAKERETWARATTFYDLVRARGMWPSFRFRYCNKYLKQWPLRLATTPADLFLFGGRAGESRAREKLSQFTPRTMPGIFHKSDIFRPIFYWTDAQVWDYIDAHGLERNPVYNHMDRCGCWLCPLTRPAQVLLFATLHPDIVKPWVLLEQEIGHTWTYRHSLTNIYNTACSQLGLPGLGSPSAGSALGSLSTSSAPLGSPSAGSAPLGSPSAGSALGSLSTSSAPSTEPHP